MSATQEEDYPEDNIFDFAKMDDQEANTQAPLDLSKRSEIKKAVKRHGDVEKKSVKKTKMIQKEDDEEGESFNMSSEKEGAAIDTASDYSEKEKCISQCYSNDYSFKVMTKRNYTFIRMARLYTTKKGENRTFTIDLPVKDFENLYNGIPYIRKNRFYQKTLLTTE